MKQLEREKYLYIEMREIILNFKGKKKKEKEKKK